MPSKGLFARHRIDAGQRVLVEAPFVAAPHFARPDAFNDWWQARNDTTPGSSTTTRVFHEVRCPLAPKERRL
jgi:hypothetical protein